MGTESTLLRYLPKICTFKQGCKNRAIHIPIKKKWISHIQFSVQFSWEKGAYRIPGSAEKGGYSGRTSVPCHIKGVTPLRGLHANTFVVSTGMTGVQHSALV